MDITYFIRELILLNECVILRGIGGFETSYKNAVLDKKKKLISPPGKIIHFKPDLVKDNGILEAHIVKSLGISGQEASDIIDTFVQEFHDTIRDDGKVFLEGIGEFTLSRDNSISFQEIGDENYLADSFGLDVLDIEMVSSEKEDPVKPELHAIVPEKRKLSGWYIAIGILLVLIAGTSLLLVSSYSGNSIFKKSRGKDTILEPGVIVFGQQKEISEDSSKQAIGQSIDERTLPKKALSIETTPVDEFPFTSYYIIAGSFKIRKNAERLHDILLRKGFNPMVIDKGSYVRVVLGTFDNKEMAIAELRRIRNQLDQSVWLMEDKAQP